MADVLVKIGALKASLPEAERQVAEYISEHPERAGFHSISAVAESAGVSVASVSRLMKRLGLRNYKELRMALAAEIITEENLSTLHDSIKPSDDVEQITEKVFSGNIKSLEDTFKMLNQGDLQAVAAGICRAHRLVLVGIGSSGHICRDAALRFALLDVQAESYSDAQEIIIQALRLGKGDIAIGISHSGRSQITVEALRMARAGGATTVGISNYLKSPLEEHSDTFLCTSFAESRVKVAALSSRIAQMCLLDTLYLLTAKQKKVFGKAELMNNYAEELLRY